MIEGRQEDGIIIGGGILLQDGLGEGPVLCTLYFGDLTGLFAH